MGRLKRLIETFRNNQTIPFNARLRHYINIPIDDVNIKFHKKAIEDPRGVGRVSRELLKQLRLQSSGCGLTQKKSISQNVFFYSAIQWCPEKLPHPSCILIHDVIPLLFPDIFDEIARDFQIRLKSIARQADKILTISHSSAQDIARLLDIPIDAISVIYNGVTTLPVVEKNSVTLPNGKFIVYLGSFDRHKNIEVVFKAMLDSSINDINLVMIGGNKRARSLVTDMQIQERVHFLGRLKDRETGFVVSKALALVFPSIYEGFGLPPLEAAMLGTPSICSSRPAMTEVMDGVALFASPDKPEEWADRIKMLRDDALFRNKLGLLAKERAENFSWKTSSESLVAELSLLRDCQQ